MRPVAGSTLICPLMVTPSDASRRTSSPDKSAVVIVVAAYNPARPVESTVPVVIDPVSDSTSTANVASSAVLLPVEARLPTTASPLAVSAMESSAITSCVPSRPPESTVTLSPLVKPAMTTSMGEATSTSPAAARPAVRIGTCESSSRSPVVAMASPRRYMDCADVRSMESACTPPRSTIPATLRVKAPVVTRSVCRIRSSTGAMVRIVAVVVP